MQSQTALSRCGDLINQVMIVINIVRKAKDLNLAVSDVFPSFRNQVHLTLNLLHPDIFLTGFHNVPSRNLIARKAKAKPHTRFLIARSFFLVTTPDCDPDIRGLTPLFLNKDEPIRLESASTLLSPNYRIVVYWT